jgi:hypothetical protein
MTTKKKMANLNLLTNRIRRLKHNIYRPKLKLNPELIEEATHEIKELREKTRGINARRRPNRKTAFEGCLIKSNQI